MTAEQRRISDDYMRAIREAETNDGPPAGEPVEPEPSVGEVPTEKPSSLLDLMTERSIALASMPEEERAAARAHWTDQDREASFAELSKAFVPITDYLAGIPDTIPWLCEPLAYFGGVTLLAGIWKGGKSTLIANALAAREGKGKFLGSDLPHGPTLLITEEGGIPIKHKVAHLTELRVLDRKMATDQGIFFDRLQTMVASFCRHFTEPALIVIDTFAVWGELDDENDATQVTLAIRKLSTLAQVTGAAIVLIDHTRKDTTNAAHGRGIRGSGAKAATSDIFAVLDYTTSGSSTRRKLTLEGRVIEPTALALDYDSLTKQYRIVGSGEEDQSRYDKWTNGIPASGPGMSRKALQEWWELSLNPTKDRITELLAAGRLRREWGKVGNADAWVYFAQLLPVNTIATRDWQDWEDDG